MKRTLIKLCICISSFFILDACNEENTTQTQMDAGEMNAGEMNAGEMNAGEMSAGEMNAGEMSAGEMNAGEMSASEMSAGEMNASEMSAGEMSAGEMSAGQESERIFSSCESLYMILDENSSLQTISGYLKGDNHSGSCSPDSPFTEDAVILFVANDAGLYRFDTSQSEGLDTLLYLQSECGSINTELSCNDDAHITLQSEVTIPLMAGQEIYAIVDSYETLDGVEEHPFTLQVERIGELPREYHGTCTLPYELVDQEEGIYTFSERLQAGDRYQGSCSSSNYGEDAVIRFVAPETGAYRFDTNGSGFDTVLYLQATCGEEESELACNDDMNMSYESEVVESLDAGQEVFLIVDSYQTQASEINQRFTANVEFMGSLAEFSAPEILSAEVTFSLSRYRWGLLITGIDPDHDINALNATFYMNGIEQGGGDLGLPTHEPSYEGNEPLYTLISYEGDQFTVFGFLQEDEEEAELSSFDEISLYLRDQQGLESEAITVPITRPTQLATGEACALYDISSECADSVCISDNGDVGVCN